MRPYATSLFDAAAGRLTGVEARSISGKRLTVTADWFVLAAGTFETTRLLLQLDELTDGRAFSGCDALGRYFIDHLKIEVGPRQAARQHANQSSPSAITSAARPVAASTWKPPPPLSAKTKLASGYVTVRAEFPPLSIHHYVRNLGKSAQARRFLELVPKPEMVKDLRSLPPALYWSVRHKQMYFSPAMDLFVDARIEQAPSRDFTPHALQAARRAWRADVAVGLAEDGGRQAHPSLGFGARASVLAIHFSSRHEPYRLVDRPGPG